MPTFVLIARDGYGCHLEPGNRSGMARCPQCDVTLEKEIEEKSFEDSEIGQAIAQSRTRWGGMF